MLRPAIAAGLVMVVLTGCSLLTVERLELGYRREQLPRCSASMLPVYADMGLTLADAAAMAAFLDQVTWEEPDARDHAERRVAIIAGTQAGIHLLSAVYGIWQRRRCDRARRAHSWWVVVQSTPVVVPAGPPSGPVREEGR